MDTALTTRNPDTAIIGSSPWALAVCQSVPQLAATAAPVLLVGAVGTGKELIARAIHDRSDRKTERFFTVDCTALETPAQYLFGAAPGPAPAVLAVHQRLPWADCGTVYFNQISALDLASQHQLAELLQAGHFIDAAGQDVALSLRIVASSSHDVNAAVAAGTFSRALHRQLAANTIHTMPLRERSEDIAPLAQVLLTQACEENGLSPKRLARDSVRKLEQYPWPGNADELRSVVARAGLTSRGATIAAHDITFSAPDDEIVILPFRPFEETPAVEQEEELLPPWPTLAEVDREHLAKTLEYTRHNVWAAARLLGMEHAELLQRLEQYGLQRSANLLWRDPSRWNSRRRAA